MSLLAISGDHIVCQGSNLGQAYTRKMPYMLYYISSPIFVLDKFPSFATAVVMMYIMDTRKQ